MKILVEASVNPEQDGGHLNYLAALGEGIRALQETNQDLELNFMVDSPSGVLLEPHLGSVPLCLRPAPPEPRRSWKSALGTWRAPLGRWYRRLLSIPPPREQWPPTSDGYLESLGADLLHHTTPMHYVSCAVPGVITMHDLQHRHYPEFFSERNLAWREIVYPQAMRECKLVIAISEFVRQDVIRQYGLAPEKVVVARNAPLGALVQERQAAVPKHRELCERLGLPQRFLLYPALTYAHKNHLLLLDAVARLRDQQGLRISVVCPGKRRFIWPQIARKLEELRLADQVFFLDFIPAQDLAALFSAAEALVFPSLFEGAGLPVLEAMAMGLPVLCSSIPALQEYAGDAASYFDPHQADSIAEAMARVWLDPEYRCELGRRSHRQAQALNSAQSASEYMQAYRQALCILPGAPLASGRLV